MKVSLRWLTELIDLPESDPGVIRFALERLGHEVDGVELHEATWTGVTVGQVLSIDTHPDADRVRVCSVTTGTEPMSVVCGAWNFGAGAVVAFAEPGAILPGDFHIGTRTIRGVESNGMICSERELGLGDDHSGIIVLGSEVEVGLPLEEVMELPDVVFDLAITPNRPDAMSLLGIARDLGAFFGVDHRLPDVRTETTAGTPSTSVVIDDPTGCSRFTLRELQDVKVGPSPFWMRQRLRRSGMRPISNAVDVTNYVMLELGQPLHVFDAERIAGGELVVRRAFENESLVTLDGVQRDLTPADLVIADSDSPTSLAGTMGGARSEVNDATANILLEAASWDPPTIMTMSRRHGLRSEASARFERGVDPDLPLFASARAAKLIAETSGATLLDEVVDVVAVPFNRPELILTVPDVDRVLGPGFDQPTITGHLRSIGLEVEDVDETMRVLVPGFRPDLTRPVDLVEEVARLHGYDKFPESLPTGSNGVWGTEQRRVRMLRNTLVGAGLSETIHLSFIAGTDLDAFTFPAEAEERLIVRVRNPLREEEALLRTTLLPGLLSSARNNRSHGAERVALFEVGSVFFNRPNTMDIRIPDQPRRLAFVVVGGLVELGFADPVADVDARTAVALVRAMARRIGVGGLSINQVQAPGFHPSRCGAIVVDGQTIGFVGEIHPSTASHYDLDGRVAAAELDVDRLVAAGGRSEFRTPSTYPPVEFDLAFLVDDSISGDSLVAATALAAGGLLENVHVFDEYLGIEGGRSLAIHYVLRAPDRTLTSDEIAPVRTAMIEAGVALGAHLRGGS